MYSGQPIFPAKRSKCCETGCVCEHSYARCWQFQDLCDRGSYRTKPTSRELGSAHNTWGLEAAGEGFEPSLTDPESVSIHPWSFTAVQKPALSGQILRSRVSRCSPMFTPATVKSLSKAKAFDSASVRIGITTVVYTIIRPLSVTYVHVLPAQVLQTCSSNRVIWTNSRSCS